MSMSSLWRRAEEACDAGIDALSSIASSASVPLLASAADAARDALAPLRQPLAEGGWPRGHRFEIGGRKYAVEGLVSKRLNESKKAFDLSERNETRQGEKIQPLLLLSFITTTTARRGRLRLRLWREARRSRGRKKAICPEARRGVFPGVPRGCAARGRGGEGRGRVFFFSSFPSCRRRRRPLAALGLRGEAGAHDRR